MNDFYTPEKFIGHEKMIYLTCIYTTKWKLKTN